MKNKTKKETIEKLKELKRLEEKEALLQAKYLALWHKKTEKKVDAYIA